MPFLCLAVLHWPEPDCPCQGASGLEGGQRCPHAGHVDWSSPLNWSRSPGCKAWVTQLAREGGGGGWEEEGGMVRLSRTRIEDSSRRLESRTMFAAGSGRGSEIAVGGCRLAQPAGRVAGQEYTYRPCEPRNRKACCAGYGPVGRVTFHRRAVTAVARANCRVCCSGGWEGRPCCSGRGQTVCSWGGGGGGGQAVLGGGTTDE